MANAIYPKFKAQLMKAAYDLSLVGLDMRVLALDLGSYTYSATHEFVSDLGGIIARTNALSGKAVNLTTGAFDSDDPTMEAVTGADIDALVMYIKGANDAASRLVMFQDTGISTVPFTPDGSDIRIVVDSGGWFVL